MKTSFTIICFLLHISLFGQTEQALTKTYIILDGSGSMWGRLEDDVMKIEAARNALQDYVDHLHESKQVALRAYGHNREKDCQDTELIIPFSDVKNVRDQIREIAHSINPTGRTPIGISLMKALEDIGNQEAEIILISDGLETCSVDPCELMKSWRDKKVNIKVHVVGIGLTDKEKETLMCITNESGGQFKDAQSAKQLTEGLKGVSINKESNKLVINGLTESGERIWVHCIVEADGQSRQEGRSDSKFGVPMGNVEITVGVKTRNDEVFKPINKTIEITESGETVIDVKVSEPPSVRTKFIEKGEERNGVMTYGYQNDIQLLGLRPNDWQYVMPGEYEFRAQVNNDNNLTISESLEEGDKKELVFNLINTVKVKFLTLTSMDKVPLRFHSVLYQDGKEKYKVHRSNGKAVLPGIYDVHLESELNPHVAKKVAISEEENQTINIEVPVGVIKVDYVDQSGKVMDSNDKRLWLSRIDENGKLHSDRLSRANGEPIYLMPGRYQLKGWSRLGNFDILEIKVQEGERKEIKMKDKG